MRRAVYVAVPEVAMLAQFLALRNYLKVSFETNEFVVVCCVCPPC